MSITSELYNKTYQKPTNLPHAFDNLGGKTFVRLLLLIITLRLTKENFGEWSKSFKMLWLQCEVQKWHSWARGIFLTEKPISFNS